jgi:type VI secretion system Hcp family effector
MRNKKLLGILVIATMLSVGLFTTTVFGATTSESGVSDIQTYGYVKFDGLDGESTEPMYRDWSDIIGFEHHFFREIVPGTPTPGQLVFDPIVITKEVDKISPSLQDACARGTLFRDVEIHFAADYTSSGRHAYYKYEFKDAIIVDYNVQWSSSSTGRPIEEVSLVFEEVMVTYVEIDSKGNPKGDTIFHWNLMSPSPP